VRVRSRVFLTLAAGDDEFLIISNGYADFPALVRTLVARLPEAVVTEEARQLASSPPVRHADIAMVWFAVVALVYVLIVQFRG
jgi:RecJ-like exonuclease